MTPSELARDAKRVAVLGAHPDPTRPAHYVPADLHAQGVELWAVNAANVGQTLWGKPVAATLAELQTPIDVVDVFRRPDALMDHLDDLLAMSPLPKCVWLQSGIRNDAFAQALEARGVAVVQDRCMMVERRLAASAP
jgi:predicted CoA-binding protein